MSRQYFQKKYSGNIDSPLRNLLSSLVTTARHTGQVTFNFRHQNGQKSVIRNLLVEPCADVFSAEDMAAIQLDRCDKVGVADGTAFLVADLCVGWLRAEMGVGKEVPSGPKPEAGQTGHERQLEHF